MFSRNVGGVDRAVRLAAGAVLLVIGLILLASDGAHGWWVTILGSFVLATGALGFCPPYVLLGISTARPRAPAAPEAPRGAPGTR